MKAKWIVVIIMLIVGAAFVVLGIGLGANTSMYIDRTGLRLFPAEAKTIKEDLEDFQRIDVNCDSFKVEVLRGDFGLDISYFYDEPPTWSVVDGVLTVKHHSNTTFFNFGFLFYREDVIRIYIPEAIDSIKINATNDQIKLIDVDAKFVTASNDNGRIEVQRMNTEKLTVSNQNGSINLKSITSKDITVSNDNGSVTLDNIDCAVLGITQKNGSIKTTNIQAISAQMRNDNGSISAENFTTEGLISTNKNGSINIQGDLSGNNTFRNDNGSIRVAVPKREWYLNLQNDNGTIKTDRVRQKSSVQTGIENNKHSIHAENTNGSITVDYLLDYN